PGGARARGPPPGPPDPRQNDVSNSWLVYKVGGQRNSGERTRARASLTPTPPWALALKLCWIRRQASRSRRLGTYGERCGTFWPINSDQYPSSPNWLAGSQG